MLNKILVAIDDSFASQCAFETGLQLSRALGAELILVHVLDVLASDGPENPFVTVDPLVFIQNEKKIKTDYEEKMIKFVARYDALLKEKQKEAEAAGVVTQYALPHGRPGLAICKVAKENNIDLIVIGNRDRSTLKELVPGSVSNYVVHRAPCSVTIVHPDSYEKPEIRVPHSEFELAGVL